MSHQWGSAPEFYGPFHHHKERLIINQIRKQLPERKGLILEAGCGSGSLALKLAELGFRLQAVDKSSEFVGLVKQRAIGQQLAKQVRVQEADLLSLPFENGSFEAVVSADVLEHLDQDQKAVREFYRVLKPRGFCFVCVPAGEKYWGLADELVGHRRRYEKKELERLFVKTGFKVRKCLFFGGVLSRLWWYWVYAKLVLAGERGGIKRKGLVYRALPKLTSPFIRSFSWVFRLEEVWVPKRGLGLILVAQKP